MINGPSSTAAYAGVDQQVTSQPAVGQIYGKHKDGRFDVLWVDGTRSVTHLHHLYVIADDEVLDP